MSNHEEQPDAAAERRRRAAAAAKQRADAAKAAAAVESETSRLNSTRNSTNQNVGGGSLTDELIQRRAERGRNRAAANQRLEDAQTPQALAAAQRQQASERTAAEIQKRADENRKKRKRDPKSQRPLATQGREIAKAQKVTPEDGTRVREGGTIATRIIVLKKRLKKLQEKGEDQVEIRRIEQKIDENTRKLESLRNAASTASAASAASAAKVPNKKFLGR